MMLVFGYDKMPVISMAPDALPTSVWTPVAIINVVALLISPVIAVVVSLWYQRVTERRKPRIALFTTLLATRTFRLSDEHVRALNLIDVTFHDSRKVRSVWREYFDMLNNAGLNNPNGWKQRESKFFEMLTAMATAVGHDTEITHTDVERVYVPEGLVTEKQRFVEISTELLRVLKTVPHVSPSASPSPPSTPSAPAKPSS